MKGTPKKKLAMKDAPATNHNSFETSARLPREISAAAIIAMTLACKPCSAPRTTGKSPAAKYSPARPAVIKAPGVMKRVAAVNAPLRPARFRPI